MKMIYFAPDMEEVRIAVAHLICGSGNIQSFTEEGDDYNPIWNS